MPGELFRRTGTNWISLKRSTWNIPTPSNQPQISSFSFFPCVLAWEEGTAARQPGASCRRCASRRRVGSKQAGVLHLSCLALTSFPRSAEQNRNTHTHEEDGRIYRFVALYFVRSLKKNKKNKGSPKVLSGITGSSSLPGKNAPKIP